MSVGTSVIEADLVVSLVHLSWHWGGDIIDKNKFYKTRNLCQN